MPNQDPNVNYVQYQYENIYKRCDCCNMLLPLSEFIPSQDLKKKKSSTFRINVCLACQNYKKTLIRIKEVKKPRSKLNVEVSYYYFPRHLQGIVKEFMSKETIYPRELINFYNRMCYLQENYKEDHVETIDSIKPEGYELLVANKLLDILTRNQIAILFNIIIQDPTGIIEFILPAKKDVRKGGGTILNAYVMHHFVFTYLVHDPEFRREIPRTIDGRGIDDEVLRKMIGLGLETDPQVIQSAKQSAYPVRDDRTLTQIQRNKD